MPTPGHPKRTLRIDPDLWAKFVEMCPDTARGKEGGAAKVLREFIAWYTRQPRSKMPMRPTAAEVAAWKGRQARGDHGGSSGSSE